jgi:hypothetical protein
MTSVPSKTSLGAQNMNTGPEAPENAENDFGRAKQENKTRLPDTAEISPSTQNMKTGPEAPRTAENEFGRGNQENRTRRPGTAENESGSQNHGKRT